MRNDAWSVKEELLKNKRLYCITSGIAVFFSLIVSFSIPTQFTSRIIVSPETKFLHLEVGDDRGLLSRLVKDKSAFAKADIDIYSEVLHSNDFRNLVKQIEVKTGDSNFRGSYQKYLESFSDFPWYFKFLDKNIDELIDENVKYSVNRATNTLTLQVRSCDPYISATMPDSLKNLLHQALSRRYRSLYQNIEKSIIPILSDAKLDYQKKIAEYDQFRNTHEGIKDKTYMTVQTTLQRDARSAYKYYSHISTLKKRMHMLSEKEDIYLTPLINASVAKHASNPHYIANALIWLFYSVVFTSFYVLYRKKFKFSGKEGKDG